MLLDKSKVKYVLFDWDGTLSDNGDIVISSVNQVLKEHGMKDWEQQKDKRNPKLSLWDNFANIFGHNWQAAYARYVEIYKQHIPSMVRSFPNAEKVLKTLKEDGVELMIMTNKDPQLLEIELPLLYNPNLFSRITPGHEAPKDKPYPEHIFYTLRGLLTPQEINPQDVWMVGDSNQDSDCALAANVLPIRINTYLFDESYVHSSNIAWFKDFDELYNLLAKN